MAARVPHHAVRKSQAMKNGLSRWPFFAGTLGIVSVVSILIYLIGTRLIFLPPDAVASTGIVGQMLLVRGREARILPLFLLALFHGAGV